MIYADNGAAEKPSAAAAKAFSTALKCAWANPNSAHKTGQNAYYFLEKAKSAIAKCINCEPDEVYFCSCACEAISWAVKCLNSVCSTIDYENIEHGCTIDALEKGEQYFFLNKKRRGAVSMLANNETGTIYPIPKGNVLRFVDATAAVGHIPVDFKQLGCDYLCADALKFGGIGGAAFLIIKRGAPIVPLIYGNNERGGTPPVPIICAMAAALKEKKEKMQENIYHTVRLRDYVIDELLKIPGAHLNGKASAGSCQHRLPGNVNISFEGIDGSALALRLSQSNIMVSTGSACTSGNNAPSHVLLALGVPPELARGTIRITLNENNTMIECKTICRDIADGVKYLRSFAGESDGGNDG